MPHAPDSATACPAITRFATLGLLLATAAGCTPQTQTASTGAPPAATTVFYAAVGPELTSYRTDLERATLVRQGALTVPENVQYAWPHPSKEYLYVAWSNGINADRHGVSVLRIDPESGVLSHHGEPVPLPWRPVHLTVDVPGTHVLIAYNNPSTASVHRIRPDGTLGSEVMPVAPLDGGIYAHQIRVDPSNRSVIMVARGNEPTASRAEDPGALKLYGYSDGVLQNRASIAPAGGYGFQPRHIDFHPARPWVFLAVERQNKLAMFRKTDTGILEPEPAFSKDTLDEPENVRPGQMTGPIHVHPNGRFVYIGNRASATREIDGTRTAAGGENTVAVFAIDPVSGEPTRIQSVDTRGYHPRTMALDPSGQLMIVANTTAMPVSDGSAMRTVPASHAVFHVEGDGTLRFVRKYDVEPGRGSPFWVGFLALP